MARKILKIKEWLKDQKGYKDLMALFDETDKILDEKNEKANTQAGVKTVTIRGELPYL